MSDWNDFSRKIEATAEKAAEGAVRLADSAKIKYKLFNLRSKESSYYEELGRLRYSELRDYPAEDGTTNHVIEIEELCDKIDEIKKKISELEGQKPANKCPKCGNQTESGMMFCPKCGTKLK